MYKIPNTEALFLVRALGLLISQVGVYGPTHKVTQSAQRSVFAELSKAVDKYTTIDFTCAEDKILVNGSSDDLDPATIRNLRDRMMLHKLGGLIFSAPMDDQEFQTCISLLASPPGKLDEQGGFEAILQKANFKSIRTLNVNYRRVVGNAPTPPDSRPGHESPQKADAAYSGVLDLSEELDTTPFSDAQPTDSTRTADAATPPTEPANLRNEINAILSEVITLLARNEFADNNQKQESLAHSLRTIRDMLRHSTEDSQTHIAGLAKKVQEDRQTIASIESSARRRGLLKLTREELVERYAELNQEIVQPLTVSTGVIDLLNSGQLGAMNESQRDLLKLAAESVERVNQLVAYMNRIAGLPENYTPDAGLIRETYH